MDIFPIEVWVVFQMVIDLFLIMLFLLILKGMKSEIKKNTVKQVAKCFINLVKPVLSEAELVSRGFDVQLAEKRKLINGLNKKLDIKIDKLNSLLNKYDLTISSKVDKSTGGAVYNRQKEIIRLHEKGDDSYTISKKLLITKTEVELLLDFKKKKSLN